MELLLNIAWALCSLGLVIYWLQAGVSRRVPRGTQVLALAMVVVLLLPVISLSDDILLAQSPAETDSTFRRSAQRDVAHSVAPLAMALLTWSFLVQPSLRTGHVPRQSEGLSKQPSALEYWRFSRPPPRA